MENYSTLTRDKSFQKRTFKYILFSTLLLVTIYGAIFIAENYFASNAPSGDNGSSFATIANGTNAWSQLLEKSGYEVVRDKGSVTFPVLDNIDTYSSNSDLLDLKRETSIVVILGGSLPDTELKQVEKFVSSGGRLITDNPDILYSIFNDKIEISLDGSKSQEISDSKINGTEDINKLEGSGVGEIAFSNSLNAQALIQSSNTPQRSDRFGNYSISAMIQLGKGDVIALIDTGVVSNEGIVRADNALLSIKIAGQTGNKVTFAEGIHGFSSAKGFNAMPQSWKISILGLIAAFIIFGSSRARRFGVGEEPPRSLGPRRIQFAHVLAIAMKKSK